jgi:hypothetical protein
MILAEFIQVLLQDMQICVFRGFVLELAIMKLFVYSGPSRYQHTPATARTAPCPVKICGSLLPLNVGGFRKCDARARTPEAVVGSQQTITGDWRQNLFKPPTPAVSVIRGPGAPHKIVRLWTTWGADIGQLGELFGYPLSFSNAVPNAVLLTRRVAHPRQFVANTERDHALTAHGLVVVANGQPFSGLATRPALGRGPTSTHLAGLTDVTGAPCVKLADPPAFCGHWRSSRR